MLKLSMILNILDHINTEDIIWNDNYIDSKSYKYKYNKYIY